MSEENVARRIDFEMRQRGWSQERMAQEMAEAGHPMHQTSVSKIVRPSGKRRTISVDEALGFAKVFKISLEDLLLPLEAVLDERVRDVLSELDSLNRSREAIDRRAEELNNGLKALQRKRVA